MGKAIVAITNRLSITMTHVATMLLLVSSSVTIWAQQVTPEQAKLKAMRFLQTNHSRTGSQHRAPAQSSLNTAVVFDATDQTGHPYLYAVSADLQDGFVLVSGDERFTDVLGYSLSGSFDEQTMPDNVRAWVQGYIDEMKYLDSIGYQPSLSASQTTGAKVSINPLVTTKWDQGSPYNDLCPLDGGSHSATGCLATAMAQIVNYHMQKYNNPTAIASAIEGYTTWSRQITVPGIAAGTPLPNKNDLLDTYDNTATDAQKNAVASLMLYCGVSLKMDFTNNGSFTYSQNVPGALINNFGFDATTHLISRSNYTYAEWTDLMYNELAASRPICYGGTSSGGGHSFVVDGYDSTNALFHINWGWGGYLDDYFALSVLTPNDNGLIGASSSKDGYNIDQGAIIGIQIGSGQSYSTPIILETSDFRVSGQDVIYAAFNWTAETHNFYMGIGIMDDAGGITQIGDATLYYLAPSYGSYGHQVTVPTNPAFANQTQKIVPINKIAEMDDTWYTGSNPEIHYYTASYDANGVPSLTVHPIVSFQSNGFILPDNMYVDETQSVKVSMTNLGDEFYGIIYLFASTTQTKGRYATYIGVTALENSNQTIIFDWLPKTTGLYHLWVATDDQGANVIASTDATVTSRTALEDVDATNPLQNNDWYTIDGRHLNSHPSQPGIYINRGKKILVK